MNIARSRARRSAAVLLFCMASVLSGLLSEAWADEQIDRYDGDLTIRPDGALEVVETIDVRAEGRSIRRGIYRDFPTDYRTAEGRTVSVSFEVLGTRRGGRTEPHHLERRGNGVRLYLGDGARTLDPGPYRYEIRYRTRGQLGYFDAYDEIYWNVTGNGWAFPIGAATATVRLPVAVPAEALRLACYTGAYESREQACSIKHSGPRSVTFESDRALGAGEGLTVAVGFPKGLVTRPGTPPLGLTASDEVASGKAPWRRGLSWVTYPLGILLVLAYYLRAWRAVGRDPEPGVIVPRYEAPEGRSPAALRYVRRMGYDSTCLAAALVKLAVRGAIRIDEDRGFLTRSYAIERLPGTPPDLAPGEAIILERLFDDGAVFKFEKDNHATVAGTLKAHETALAGEHRRRHFRLNRDRVAWGAVLSGAVLVLQVMVAGLPPPPFPPVLELLVINLLFLWLIRAPTAEGRRLMDAIEGFKLYLAVAEKDTFAQLDRPRTLEEFERQLPYAVALDCASTWVDYFEDELARLADAGELGERGWLAGAGLPTAERITASVDGLASGLGSAIASSSTPPGSSSGSSGGGFSGGGGGGGGGGGW